MSGFRVRSTDDSRKYWTVADGSCVDNTQYYINSWGKKDKICATYSTEAKAQEALDLYLEKQKSLQDTTAKKLFGHTRFYAILSQMEELHSRKNHDYAGASDPLKNLRACERLNIEPFMGVMIRLQDKWSRLEEFVKSGKLIVKSESVVDTLLDNAVYSILAIILYEESQKKDE